MRYRESVPTLGPEIRVPMFGISGLYMRIGDDLRKSVVFFGYEDVTPGRNGINCVGTGFLLNYDGLGYLVTAKHLSSALGANPFLLRVNKHDGTSENLIADRLEWFDHPEPTVDVSLFPFHIGQPSPYDAVYLNGNRLLLSDEQITSENIGVGNLTYTIGLFRLLSGEKRNMPICHCGAIAMVPQDEKIPLIDWTDVNQKRHIFVDGYLVEAQSLSGLSGSPVFVRPEHNYNLSGLVTHGAEHESMRSGENPIFVGPRAQLRLLGLWQGSWDAPPDEVRAVEQRVLLGVKVPVGMGVVVPCQRIVEVLQMPKVKAHREQVIAARSTMAARPQSVRPISAAPATKDENPQHQEDFSRLLNAAVKAPRQGGKT